MRELKFRAWDKKSYTVEYGDEGYIFFNAEATKAYFTVIGNIYENPELLEIK